MSSSPTRLLPLLVAGLVAAGCGSRDDAAPAAGAGQAAAPASQAASVPPTGAPAAPAAAVTGGAPAAAAPGAVPTAAAQAPAPAATPAATPVPGGFAPSAEANRIPLGSSERAVLERLGEPAKRLRNAEYRCLVYATDAGPDTWLRMCFKDDRMTGLGTIPGRDIAFTLDVPEPKGRGKLVRPKVKDPKVAKPKMLTGKSKMMASAGARAPRFAKPKAP